MTLYIKTRALILCSIAVTQLVLGATQLQIDRSPIQLPKRASTKGSAAARFGMIEFSDYQCPFCARHATEALPGILEEFVDTGKLRYFVFNFPLEAIHPLAPRAAQAAECAGLEGKFWEMHGLLFRSQKMLLDTPIATFATALELHEASFDECLKSGKASAAVLADMALGTRLGIRGTPTFLFGEIANEQLFPLKKVTGALPFEILKGTILELLSGKLKATADMIDERAPRE